MAVTPIIISEAPEKYRPFLEKADNYEESDTQKGVLNAEEEINKAMTYACTEDEATPSDEANKKKLERCYEFSSYVEGRGSETPQTLFNGNVSLFYLGRAKKVLARLDNLEKRITPDDKSRKERLEALYALGTVAALQAEDYNKAIFYLDKLIELNPKDRDIVLARAELLMKLAKPDEAERLIDGVLKVEPQYANALYAKGLALNSRKKYEEALKYFDQVIALKPENNVLIGAARHMRADVLYFLDKKEASLKELEALATEFPSDWLVFESMGQILFEFDRNKDTVMAFEKCFEVSAKLGQRTRNPTTFLRYGIVLERLGRHEDAIKQLDIALELQPKWAEALNEKCVVLFNLKDKDKAFQCMKEVVKIDPNYGDAYRLKAAVLRVEGKLDEALKLVDKALKLSPESGHVHLEKGRILMDLKMFEKAVKEFDEAIKSSPYYFLPYEFKAAALTKLLRYDEAEKVALHLLKLNPESYMAHVVMGVVAMTREDSENAKIYIEKAFKMAPSNPMVCLYHGLLMYMIKKPKEALDEIDRAIGLGMPLNAPQHIIRGELLALFGRTDESVAEYKAAIAQLPKEAAIYEDLGWVLVNAGRLDEAKEQFEKMIALDPKSAGGYYGLSGIFLRSGKFDEAERYLDKTIKLNPMMPNAYSDKGVIRSQQGKVEEAIAFFDEAIQQNKGHELAYSNKTFSLMLLHKPEEALKTADIYLAINPDSVDINYAKGLILSKTGHYAESKPFFDKVLSVEPDHLGAHFMRGVALSEFGDYKGSLAELERVTQLDPNNALGYFIKGVLYLNNIKNYGGATEAFKKAQGIMPNNVFPRYYLAKARFAAGDYDDALTWVDSTISKVSDISDPFLLKAKILFSMGKYDGALEALNKAVDIGKFTDPRIPTISEGEVDLLRADVNTSKRFQKMLQRYLVFCEEERKKCHNDDEGYCFGIHAICGDEVVKVVPKEYIIPKVKPIQLPGGMQFDWFNVKPGSMDSTRERHPSPSPFNPPQTQFQ